MQRMETTQPAEVIATVPRSDAMETPIAPSGLENVGSEAGLSAIELCHQDQFLRAVETARQKSWLYYFPFLYCFSKAGSHPLLWEAAGDAICIYFLKTIRGALRLQLYLPPFPFGRDALAAAESRMRLFNGDRTYRVVWAEEMQRRALEESGYECELREREFIYSGELVRRASGKQFESLRRNLSRVRRLPGLVARDYRVEDQDDCLAVLAKWRRHLRDDRDIEIHGYGYTVECIRNAFAFKDGILRGEVLAIGERCVAFTFGGRIRPQTGSLFTAISDHDVPGLGYLQRARFIANAPEFELINDSSDAGRAGIDYVKSRFRAVEMNNLYQAYRED
jgi:hypothetical protein